MSYNFDFANLLGGLMNLMPMYLQGRQQAITDNWNDGEKYNTVKKGQLEALIKENTAANDIAESDIKLNNALYGMEGNAMGLAQAQALHPGNMTRNRILSAWTPWMMNQRALDMMLTRNTNLAAIAAAGNGFDPWEGIPQYMRDFSAAGPGNGTYWGYTPSSLGGR